jgi:hypothetical protein
VPFAVLLACGFPQVASACVYLPITYIFDDPPAHLTAPAEIEAWKQQQIEETKARDVAALGKRWRAYKGQLAVEAREGGKLGAGRLAEALAVDMVPPPLPQVTTRDDCGNLYGAEVADPAGYLDAFGSDPQLAAFLAELGVLKNAEEFEALPPRARRALAWPSFPCAAEARDRVRRTLLGRFSEAELAHVWSTVHRLGFDYNSVEAITPRDQWSGPRDYRLLKFSTGRSGPLVFSDQAEPVDHVSRSNPRVRLAQSRDTAELRQFFETDPVAYRMVDVIEGEIAGVSVERCPNAAAELAAELRTQLEEYARLHRR